MADQSDNEEGQEENRLEDDLRSQIVELKRKLTISEENREKSVQESVFERNRVIERYQEEISRVGREKDDEIRVLSRANELYRNLTRDGQPKRGHEIPMPRQILFDGKNAWEGFAKPFYALVDTCKWSEEEALFRLQSSLRGEAAEFAFNQTSADTLESFSKLMTALESRYKERRTSSSYLAELEGRKFQPKEKLAEYVSDIRKLVIKGYPTADTVTRETINVRHFIKGLQDQQAALFIGMKDPKNIDEARTILETYNSLRDEVKGTGVRVREVKPKNKSTSTEYVTENRLQAFGREIKTSLGKKIDGLANKITASQTSYQDQRPAQGRNRGKDLSHIVCYKCGESGHYSKTCSSRGDGRKNTQQSTN